MNKLTVLSAFATLAGMILFPADCIAAAASGLETCYKIMLPALLPFFICSKLLVKSGFAKKIGDSLGFIMRPLFNVPGCGAYAFVIGILSGFPVGAKCAAELYGDGLCSKTETQRLVCFCNNSGPIFIIGAVAAGMLYNRTAGIYLYTAHILSAVTVGIILGKVNFEKSDRQTSKHSPVKRQATGSRADIFSSSVAESVDLILFVCGFIIFFNVFSEVLSLSGVVGLFVSAAEFFNLSEDIFTAVFYTFIEVTGGVKRLSALPIGALRLPLISMALGWGGLSVMLQVFGVTDGCGLSKRIFIAAKAMQSVLAGIYTALLLCLPLGDVAVFNYADAKISTGNVWTYSLLSVISSIFILMLINVIAACGKKLSVLKTDKA